MAIEHSSIMKYLELGYDKAVNGLPLLESASELGDHYLGSRGDLSAKVDRLINWQCAKSATAGFVTGLGGLLTLPVALPVNIASVLFLQIRMIAAIGHMAKLDIKSDEVKTFCLLCTTGSVAGDIIKDVGVGIGTKLSHAAIGKVSGQTLTAINQKVGFRLLTKYGSKGALNLGKAVPLVGGVVGATWDGGSTKIVGKTAKKLFIVD